MLPPIANYGASLGAAADRIRSRSNASWMFGSYGCPDRNGALLARELEKQYKSGALTWGLPHGNSERVYRLRPDIRRGRRRVCGIRGYVNRGAAQVARTARRGYCKAGLQEALAPS